MPISLKLKDVVWFDQAGNMLLREGIRNVINAKGLPVKKSYHLGKIGKKLVAELQEYQEKRVAIFLELGEEETKEVDGKRVPTGNLKPKPENAVEFAKQQEELLDSEFTIDLDPVKIDDLGDKADLSPVDLMACEKIIID